MADPRVNSDYWTHDRRRKDCRIMCSEALGQPGPTFPMKSLTPDDFARRCYIIGVNGGGANKWGHTILEVKQCYFQVARPGTHFPCWLDPQGFKDYMVKESKKLWWRVHIKDITNPAKAWAELDKQLHETWTWGIMWHNCQSFAERIVHAGGSKFAIPRHKGFSLPGALAVYGPMGQFDP